MIELRRLGSRIGSKRQERGMTQSQLAEHMGITPQAVSKWENGISFPDLSRLDELAELLGMDIQGLLMGKEDEEL